MDSRDGEPKWYCLALTDVKKRVIIVGGVAGGASAAARLRRLDENAEIVIFERGAFVSFANCGLPYRVGDVITDERKLLVATPELLRDRFRIEVHTEHEVTAIDRATHAVAVPEVTDSPLSGQRRAGAESRPVLGYLAVTDTTSNCKNWPA
jgi:NADPH-dependent 2,4-dienoyl-CoA reductase/sulfur reductase-like enzyme